MLYNKGTGCPFYYILSFKNAAEHTAALIHGALMFASAVSYRHGLSSPQAPETGLSAVKYMYIPPASALKGVILGWKHHFAQCFPHKTHHTAVMIDLIPNLYLFLNSLYISP
jgi:hypothetical protein